MLAINRLMGSVRSTDLEAESCDSGEDCARLYVCVCDLFTSLAPS